MEPWGREVAAFLCLPAPLITLWAWRRADGALRRRFLHFALPLAGIALVVFVSALNPNMRVLFADGKPEMLLPHEQYRHFLPSTALPAETLSHFLLNAGLVLVGLNLFLAAPPRRLQRLFLAVVAGNAALLACVGTIFKLTGATAVFGRVSSPNPHFFASFFYYNHWGAFAVLGAGAAAGLAIDFAHRERHTPWHHTPALLLGVLTLLLLVSLPLSGGRASLVAGLLLVAVVAGRLAFGLVRSKRHTTLIFAGLLGVAAIAAAAWLARSDIAFSLKKTSNQLADVRAGGVGDARARVYKDTWHLFLQHPVYGSGWHSFAHAFRLVQTFEYRLQTEQKIPTIFFEAHNDWLQLLAELGLVGAGLSLAAILGIAHAAPLREWRRSPVFELMTGVGGVGLMACVDFPFACPAVVVTVWTLTMTAAAIAYDRRRQAEIA